MKRDSYQGTTASRWEYTKSRSNWHFDPTVVEEQPYYNVCTFSGEWAADVEKYTNLASPVSRINVNDFENQTYIHNDKIADLVRAGADPTMEIFTKSDASDSLVFKKIADYLGMDQTDIKFHDQTTGQMLVWHIDTVTDGADGQEAGRFFVALDNWKHGQIIAMGNSFWHQWKKGECITWDSKHLPHGTCNMGWEPRPLLQITGLITERTKEIIKNGCKNKIIAV